MDNIYRIIEKEHGKRKNELLRKDSNAEKHFARLLNEASVYYVKEKCCYDKYGNWCYIDFYIPFYKIAIEIDGKEHSYGKRKQKDIKKECFLKDCRNISTIRFTNEECLSMESISVVDIVKKANKVSVNKGELEHKRKNRCEELKRASTISCFDVYSPIYIYDKDKDAVFAFKDLYIAKHSTGVPYQSLINAVDSNNIHKSRLFIISTDRKRLDAKINEYYEYLWGK